MRNNSFKKRAILIVILMISSIIFIPSIQAISLPKNSSRTTEDSGDLISNTKSIHQARDFSLVIHRIKQDDEIDLGTGAEWKLRMYVNGERKNCQVDGNDITLDKTYNWEEVVPSGQELVEIKLELQEEDWGWWGNDDIADISAHVGGGKDDSDDFDDHRGAVFIRNFNLETNDWVPEDENNDYLIVDDISDVKWYKTSGNFDGSTKVDENDATVWFNLFYENLPPYTPERPSGPNEGETNITYTFQTRCRDPDGDRVQYGWDWDGDRQVDELTGFYDSWETCTIQHKWLEAGMHAVRVLAIDERGMTSELSEPLLVEIGSKNGKTGAKIEKTWYGYEFTLYLDHKETQDLVKTIKQGSNVVQAIVAVITTICAAAGIPVELGIATAIATAIVRLGAEAIQMMDMHNKGVYFKIHVVAIWNYPIASAAYVWAQS